MKKEYKKPQFFIVQMATQQMLAISKDGEYTGGQTLKAPRGPQQNNYNGVEDEEDEDEEDW